MYLSAQGFRSEGEIAQRTVMSQAMVKPEGGVGKEEGEKKSKALKRTVVVEERGVKRTEDYHLKESSNDWLEESKVR
jgi:hypothetical protein